jgi:predicted dehydrogenase
MMLKKVFSDSDIDAVVIATPVRSHFDLTVKRLESRETHVD